MFERNENLSYQRQVTVDGKPIIVERFDDFSPQVTSLQTKFFSVSLLSLFVSIFDLDEKSKFFGVSANDVNERAIEFGVFFVAFLLGTKYLLRTWEERDTFLQISKRIKTLNSEYKSQVLKLQSSHEAFTEKIRNSGFLDERF